MGVTLKDRAMVLGTSAAKHGYRGPMRPEDVSVLLESVGRSQTGLTVTAWARVRQAYAEGQRRVPGIRGEPVDPPC